MTKDVMSVHKRKTTFDVVVNPRNASVWDRINHNSWEEYTFNILDRFLNKNHNYLDIGAWIGPTVLYGAHLAKHVYAVEPDPVAFRELNENLNLNSALSSKVTTVPAALSKKSGTANLYVRSEFGDSSSSLIPTKSDTSCSVECITIAELIKKYAIQDLSLIKIDIEGSEYSLIPSMKEYLEAEKPALYLSIHPEFLKENLIRQYTSQEKLEYKYRKITRNLIKNLRMYKYIYDTSGNLVSEETILNEATFKEYLFTNESLEA